MAAPLKITPQTGSASTVEEWVAEARAHGRPDPYVGKRREPRYLWSAPLEIHVHERGGRTETLYATARNISTGGMGFQSHQPIAPYSTIHICLAGEMVGVRAVVKHCAPGLSGHIIGAGFEPEEQPATPARAVKVG